MKKKILLRPTQMRMLLDKIGIPPCCKSLSTNGATINIIYNTNEIEPRHQYMSQI
ncbi:hypothetical protein [Flavobacterium sp. UBA7680]|uniref:hypothetical protein n=1 Tax=Flavobacterium sp. UBA7680 TaxID=1946559 RepID=UPI0025C2AE03|nr:hypothetical protein [Flavobacterium sp. UBA7680]